MKRKKPDQLAETLDRFFAKMETIETKLDTLAEKMEIKNLKEDINDVLGPLPNMYLKPKKVKDVTFLRKFEESCDGEVYYEPNYVGITAAVRYNDAGILNEIFVINDRDEKDLIISDRQDVIAGIPAKIDATNEMIRGVITCKQRSIVSDSLDPFDSLKGDITKILLNDADTDLELCFIAFIGTEELHNRFGDYEEFLNWLEDNQFIIPEAQGMFFRHSINPYGMESEYYFNGAVAKNSNIINWPLRYASTYQFVKVLYPTNLINISWQTTFEGLISGVGQISPVIFEDGNLYTQCLIPNFDGLIKTGVNQGALVEVYEIKPGHIAFGAPEKLGNGKRFFKPNRCPTCQSDVITRDERCSNSQCSGMMKNKLIKAVWPEALDIDGFEAPDIEKLYYGGRLKTLGDLFLLTENDLTNIGISKKNAKKILVNIGKLDKGRPLCFWLNALDIPGLSIGRCLEIEKYIKEYYEYTRLDDLMDVLGDKDTLASLCGIEVMGVSAYTVLHYSAIYDFLSLFNWPKFNIKSVGKYESVSIVGRCRVNYERLQQALYQKGFLLDETLVESDKCVLIGDSPAPIKMSLVSRYMLNPINIVDMSVDDIVKAVTEMKNEM